MKILFPSIVSLIVFVISMWFTNFMTNAIYVAWVYSVADFDRETAGSIIESEFTHRSRGSTYKIRYTYAVKEKSYLSDIISFKQNNRDTAYITHKAYPVGKDVLVYYDSRNPNYSTLAKDKPTTFLWFQAFCIFIASALISFVAFGYAKKWT